MEEQEAVWRIWVDTRRKVVSFHEEEGSQLMEFRSWEMFIHCVDEYAKKRYRYQLYRKSKGKIVQIPR